MKIIFLIIIVGMVLISGCNKKIECYPCIMVFCDDEEGGRWSNGCHLHKDVAEEKYNEWLNDTNCVNVTIDYDFLNRRELCYEDGVLID